MNDAARQELAEIGRPTDENELEGDDQLFRALVSGCQDIRQRQRRQDMLLDRATGNRLPNQE